MLRLTTIAGEIERRWMAHEAAFEEELDTMRAAHGSVAVDRALDLLRQRKAEAAA